jgi:hypothetical protein
MWFGRSERAVTRRGRAGRAGPGEAAHPLRQVVTSGDAEDEAGVFELVQDAAGVAGRAADGRGELVTAAGELTAELAACQLEENVGRGLRQSRQVAGRAVAMSLPDGTGELGTLLQTSMSAFFFPKRGAGLVAIRGRWR